MADATTRPYVMRDRADSVEATKLRITEAAVHLHETLGPARTTLSAIAQQAGVQRQTLYRHFEDEAAMVAACSAHYWSGLVWPDAAAWESLPSLTERLSAAIPEVYAFHSATESMIANVLRDAEVSSSVRESLRPYEAFFAAVVDSVCADLPSDDHRRALVAHALDFRTWRSLAGRHRLTTEEIVAAMTTMVST